MSITYHTIRLTVPTDERYHVDTASGHTTEAANAALLERIKAAADKMSDEELMVWFANNCSIQIAEAGNG